MSDEKRKPKFAVKLGRAGKTNDRISLTAWFCAGVATIFAGASIALSYSHEWAAAAGVFPLGLIACLMFARIDSEPGE